MQDTWHFYLYVQLVWELMWQFWWSHCPFPVKAQVIPLQMHTAWEQEKQHKSEETAMLAYNSISLLTSEKIILYRLTLKISK